MSAMDTSNDGPMEEKKGKESKKKRSEPASGFEEDGAPPRPTVAVVPTKPTFVPVLIPSLFGDLIVPPPVGVNVNEVDRLVVVGQQVGVNLANLDGTGKIKEAQWVAATVASKVMILDKAKFQLLIHVNGQDAQKLTWDAESRNLCEVDKRIAVGKTVGIHLALDKEKPEEKQWITGTLASKIKALGKDKFQLLIHVNGRGVQKLMWDPQSRNLCESSDGLDTVQPNYEQQSSPVASLLDGKRTEAKTDGNSVIDLSTPKSAASSSSSSSSSGGGLGLGLGLGLGSTSSSSTGPALHTASAASSSSSSLSGSDDMDVDST